MRAESIVFLLLTSVLVTNAFSSESSEEDDSDEHGQSLGMKMTNCACGWTNKAKSRIVGGRKTGLNEYPYMALLVIVRTNNTKNERCGAGIITRRHAITAAHCVTPSEFLTYDYQFLMVGDREVSAKNRKSPFGAIYTVSRYIRHPEYNEDLKNDIAIVFTERPIEFSLGVGPVCLPTSPMYQFLVDSAATLRISGWGKPTDKSQYSDHMRKVNLKVVALERCNDTLPQGTITFDVITQICVVHATKDTCNGDSGSPLVWLDPDTNRYTAVGVVSYGYICGAGYPSVNTDVSHYVTWIRDTIADSGLQICSKQE